MKIAFIIIIFTLVSTPFFVMARTWLDTYYEDQDYLRDINIYPYDNTDAGDGIVVALIGDGVQTDHIDYWQNVGAGWNFIDDTSEITPYGPYDTAVAGIVAATADVKGTIGIVPQAEIMSLVVCDADTCYKDYIIEAIEYAVDNGADVIALTLGPVDGIMDYSEDYDEATQYAYDNDVIVVGGMEPESDSDGNEVPMSPGCNDVDGLNTMIGVGGSDDYNDATECVDVLVPTTDIFAAKVAECSRQSDCFETMSGVPLGIGMVTGVVALIRDLISYRSVMEIIDSIVSTTDDGFLQGSDAIMSSLKISLDDIGFSTVYTSQTIVLTGEHFNPRLKFKLVNDQTVLPLTDGITVLSPELIELIISDDVSTGKYYLQINNYSEKTSPFEIVNLLGLTQEEKVADEVKEEIDLTDLAISIVGDLAESLAGYILLQVEQHGEAWYVNPVDNKRYYMKNGAVAYEMMRSFGLGITNDDLELIPAVAAENEMLTVSSVCSENSVANQVRGQILLQVEEHGEAWYVHPDNCYRVYMKDGDSAYSIMQYLSLGISDVDLESMSQ